MFIEKHRGHKVSQKTKQKNCIRCDKQPKPTRLIFMLQASIPLH